MTARKPSAPGLIKANLVHLGRNMWSDRPVPHRGDSHTTAADHLRFDTSLWKDLLDRMVAAGMNMVVLDLGEGVRYDSHPELGVKGSWTPKKLRRELDRLRRMGLEPIPKLNFSACHDVWLGPYARMVSTKPYYDACADLIAEVCELFDRPRFFHLGMDEETERHQQFMEYAIIRQGDLWWHDLEFLVEQVEKGGSRAWVWSDYVWEHHDEFYERMPASVVQSNWYYARHFGPKRPRVRDFIELGERGYDQIPTGSNFSVPENFEYLVQFCRQHVSEAGVLGFLQTNWRPTIETFRERHMQAVELVERAFAGAAE